MKKAISIFGGAAGILFAFAFLLAFIAGLWTGFEPDTIYNTIAKYALTGAGGCLFVFVILAIVSKRD